MNDRGCRVARRTDGVAWLVLLSLVTPGGAGAEGNSNQFGAQDRANAISLMTVLAVQQGISSLPPTSGQSFVYVFDTEQGTYIPSPVLGPTVFRTADTIGAHTLSLRAGVSYFDLSESFGPIDYLVEFDQPTNMGSVGVVGLGSTADINVTVMNLSASYGVNSWLELMFNLPLTVVHADASQTASTARSSKSLPPKDALVAGTFQTTPLPSDPTRRAADIKKLRQGFQAFINPSCGFGDDICLTYRHDSFNALGFDFNQGTHAGVGQISLGGKASLYTGRWLQFAFMTEFFTPSPSEDEFAGPASAAILPRAVLAVPAADWLRVYGDIGYDYNFGQSALRRLTWNAGPSVPMERFELDLGISGSEYDTPVHWTPTVARGIPGSTLTALGDTHLGDNFVDFIAGLKFRLPENWVLSGAVDVPVNNQGFRPAALGTLAIEYYVHAG